MPAWQAIRTRLLRDPHLAPRIREVCQAWRRLASPRTAPASRPAAPVKDDARRTLLAVSGGADSSAMAIMLAAGVPSAARRLVIAHVVHDLRPREQALADRDRAQALAQLLGVPFVWTDVHVRDVGGNAEANARTARYAALADLALRHACPYIATAHQSDDLLETVLMRLVRGAGPRGLSGVPPRRSLRTGPVVVRPMLALSRSICEQVCAAADWRWVHDATNDDLSRTRALLRARVLPTLRSLAGSARLGQRLVRSTALLRDADALARARARGLLRTSRVAPASASTNALCFARDAWRSARPVIAGHALRILHASLDSPAPAPKHRTHLIGSAPIAKVLSAIADAREDRRTFNWPAMTIRVEARRIIITPRTPPTSPQRPLRSPRSASRPPRTS